MLYLFEINQQKCNKSHLYLFSLIFADMSSQKEKYFYRQHSKFIKGGAKEQIYQSVETRTNPNQSELKQETITQGLAVRTSEIVTEEKTAFSLASSAQQNLKRLIACQKTDFEILIRDKILRQDLKKQQRRLTKARNDNKLTVQTDTELSILAINGIISLAQEYINDVNKEKAQKVAPKSTVRVNQEKQIVKNLKTIDEQIQISNFASVKSTIQILLKKYGKDELLQEKLGYLNFILALNEQYERQAVLLKDMSVYVEKLSNVDVTPENIGPSNQGLKYLKKQFTLALNKQNKKQEPNERAVTLISSLDKIVGLLSGYIDSKTQKKIEAKSKRQIELQKQIQERIKSGQFLEQSSRFCKDLLQRTADNKDELYKQLETLKKNKKKSTEVPYSMFLRIFDNITAQKRELNEINIYLKSCSQVYLRKNLNAQNLVIQLKKLDEKYQSNETLNQIKPNLQILINNVQERQKLSKQVSAVELQLKKLKAENAKLQKLVSEGKSNIQSSVEIQKIDKRKELQEKRLKDAERLKQQKQQRQIERSLDNIFNNLQQKKWKVAKNTSNVFTKRYEESTLPIVQRYVQNLAIILNIVQDLQNAEARATEIQKRQKGSLSGLQKQKQALNERIKGSEEYEASIKYLIQNLNQEGYVTKKYFDELRRDRKKIVQQRYQLIMKLQEPISAFRQSKLSEVSEKVSLSFSSFSADNQFEKIKKERQQLAAILDKQKQKSSLLESRLKESGKGSQINKDAQQLLNLSKRIEKGGEWWKFIPKNLKNSTFKQIYTILQKYRENELSLQTLRISMVNEEVLRQQASTLSNALDSTLSLIQSNSEWTSQQFWNKNLLNFKGNKNCDKLLTCLNILSSSAQQKVDDERKNYKTEIASYELEIQNLSNAINDLQKRKDLHTQRSSSRLEESSAKKSPELKSSRRTVSRSKEKDGQVKQAMQEYVQQQRKMLSKIQQLQGDKQNLEAKATAIQNELILAERRLEDQRIGFEEARFAAEKIRLQQLQKINELEGELQINEGRRIELQAKLDTEIISFGQMQKQLSSKLHQFQKKQAKYHDKQKDYESQTLGEAQQRITSELNYYRQMYGQLSKQLQITKEKQQRILKDYESLQKNNQILERKYHADIVVYKQASQKQLETTQISQLDQANSPLKMRPYKIDLNSSKIVDLYLDSERFERVRQGEKQKHEVKQHSHPQIHHQNHQIIELKHIIQRLQGQLRQLKVQKSEEIEREVILALKNQQSEFNGFLKSFQAEKYELFVKQILPKRLQQELAARNISNISNYQFMHNEWIIKQFPRLYEERHNRQCTNANIDVDSIVRIRLQEAKQLEQASIRVEWQEETNRRIQQSLALFQQNTIPLIIQKQYQRWQVQKAKQLELRSWQIEQYWQKVLEDQRLQHLSSKVETLVELNKGQQETVALQTYREPTELELLQIMRRERSKHILDTLFDERIIIQQQRNRQELAIQRKEIEEYWENILIPAKQRQWNYQKQQQISQLKVLWLQENDKKWNEKLVQTIQNQKTILQQATLSSKSTQTEQSIIQRWRASYLPAIIEKQRRDATQLFVKVDLPQIIEQQKAIWIKGQLIPDIDRILIEQHKKWQEQKVKEIALITSNFDIRISQILQIEHAQWQKLKIIQFQQLLTIERSRWSAAAVPNVDQILRVQKQDWELQKLEQIRGLQLDFETKINEIERQLNRQMIQYQEKSLKQQSRMAQIQINAITRWRNNELPVILAKQRQACILQFKSRQLPKILDQKYKDWEAVDLIQLIHEERNKYIIDNIISQRSKEWQRQLLKQKTAYETKLNELTLIYEKQLIKQRQQTEIVKVSNKQEDYLQWQKIKNIELQKKIKEVQHYWQRVILPERQDIWRKEQIVVVEELLTSKIAEVEAAYQQNFIPKIIDEQWKKWQIEYPKRVEQEKEKWQVELPTILKTGKYNQYLQPLIQTQVSQYELQIKKIQAQSVGSNIKIQRLTNQVAQYESKLRENRTKYQLTESNFKSLQTQHDLIIKKKIEESHKINQEITRSRWAETQVEELRKIIELQKGELSKLTATVREGQKNKLEIINLQETIANLQKTKWQQINELRSSYETKIIEFTSERNNLQARASQLDLGKRQGSEKQALLSLQRQISILKSTLKTKDAEITFLKKTIETVSIQLKQNREKHNEQLEKRASSQRLLAQMRSGRLELEYQIKYLKDREESLNKKFQLKEQEMVGLRKKIDLDSDSIEKKLKSSLEYASSYQVKFAEFETLLTIKTKQSQALLNDIDRLRYENQTLISDSQTLTTDIQQYRRQVRQLESQKTQIILERDRNIDEAARFRQALIHHQEEIKRSNENVSRLTHQINNEKLRYETQLKRAKEQILHLEIQVKDAERIKRIQIERASKLQRQLAQGSHQADIGQIQVLKKINRDVTDLTAANRQLEMKCLLLENKQRITPSASETINSFLLVQKHTDQLLDFLLKEGIVPNLEIYHNFLAKSRISLSAGRAQEYFELWQKLLRDLFQLTLSCRAEEIRFQAEQLLKLRDEMTDVLQRQIEASETDQNQLVQDYKQVITDIKSLVREYMRSGDDEYIRLLCSSLGIPI